ncbi:L-lactate transport [Desulfitobacterium dichloroeliminans LMG P-21439]|uniref:L-lactate permease n=1 Tax=Desulfitobacterium dichloroeliminans (strain LMG P-21439 / DCA1) TaxID=871963 RepID=L0F9T3_DESDL|nr:lactate permease LctP family transporter [Desulfitobacterium dichloroeliminans]AGA69785.1 L-lactate transport [Desulfitobacterium dichloroeliminans LMG P-21439]
MPWTQDYAALGGSLGLTALAVSIPIVFLFWALAVKGMKGYLAGLLALAITIVDVIIVYKMPVTLALSATAYGMLYGLWPIAWIVITAVYLYNLTVESGQFEVIKSSIASISNDRRLQALIVAFCFGAFLEGAAGFGAPVAITGALLIGLGFDPIKAAGLCLIANTAPVAFGAIGAPIIAAGAVTGMGDFVISQAVGRQLPFISVIIPLYLVILMAGWKSAKEVMPAILVTGISFAVAQWWSSNTLGAYLPDIISSLFSLVCTTVFLRFWKPKKVWRFPHERDKEEPVANKYTGGQIAKAWSPFVILTAMVTIWGLPGFKSLILDQLHLVLKFSWPGLDGMIYKAAPIVAKPTVYDAIFKWDFLSAGGTAILIAAIISCFVLGIKPGKAVKVFKDTLKQLIYPVINIAAVLGFAYLANYSGLSYTLGLFFASTGAMFPVLSPVLGWLGVFLTGSDTSANALFGKLQQVTAEQIGINPVLTVAANSSGGVVGKMISPQSIAVAAAATGLVGRESELFKFTVKHSLAMLVAVIVIICLQAYVVPGMVPTIAEAAAFLQ